MVELEQHLNKNENKQTNYTIHYADQPGPMKVSSNRMAEYMAMA